MHNFEYFIRLATSIELVDTAVRCKFGSLTCVEVTIAESEASGEEGSMLIEMCHNQWLKFLALPLDEISELCRKISCESHDLATAVS